jgi:hypothetical protein
MAYCASASGGETVIKRCALLLGLMMLAMPACAAQPIGRFFFTPAERAELEAARARRPTAPPERVPEAAPRPRPLPRTVTYEGLVRRSDGRSMLWINNRLVEEREALAGSNLRGHVRADGSVVLEAPGGGIAVHVKVGQSAELHTGKVVERERKE